MPRQIKSYCNQPNCPGVSKCRDCRRIRMRLYMRLKRQSANTAEAANTESANIPDVSANIDANIESVTANIIELADSFRTAQEILLTTPAWAANLVPSPERISPAKPQPCAFPLCRNPSIGLHLVFNDLTGDDVPQPLCKQHGKRCPAA